MQSFTSLLLVLGVFASGLLRVVAQNCVDDCYLEFIPATGCPGSADPNAPATPAYLQCVCQGYTVGPLANYLACVQASCNSPGVLSFFQAQCAAFPSGARRRGNQLNLPGSMSCPSHLKACPVPAVDALPPDARDMMEVPRAGGTMLHGECVDIMNDMDSCGGCSSVGEGVQCGEVEGVMETACVAGQCEIYTCRFGYSLSTIKHADGSVETVCKPHTGLASVIGI
ncbi:hypothetical protein CALVIDRAFT_557602 [Calocera viscosa TUFC12733]|uniref:Protein CPL1-like domain-containing protein n=1 Tax=Calocera viscosa (strain TUFC12733) TaxID=1330018 RepID=A0A167I744_CALVF|nr:hypothetical protein CALVIDRAFT_557602 [Calocera viscosa TUFC12733]